MKPQKLLFVFFTVICSQLSIMPQWSTDPNINTVICTEANKQTEVAICSNGQSGAFIVWRDYRMNSGIFEGDIYAQQLDFTGSPVWPTNGIIINNAANGQFRPKIISDEKDGAIIVWAKNGGGFYGYDLYAQRVDSDGNLLWNSNGVAIAVSSATDSFHEIIPDGQGGVIVAWQRLPTVPGQTDIYVQKIDSSGTTVWTTNGVAICTAVESQSWPKLISDLNGGAIVAWEDGRNGIGTGDIYAQRIDENGIVLWTTDGIPVCSDQAYQTQTRICSDGSGGAIIIWEDYRTSSGAIYGQRINSAGQVQWVTDGKYLSPPSTTCKLPLLISDNTGSAYIVWETEVQTMETNIGSQKIDLDGNPLWGTTGVDLCLASGSQNEIAVMNNLGGGIVASWQDFRNNPEGDIYAQWVDRDGNLKWKLNGEEICGVADVQSYPVLTNDGLAGAIISWWDLRNGIDEDIYAQNIDYRGELGTTNYYYQRNQLNKPISDGTPTSDTLTVPTLEKATNQTVFDITVKIGRVIHDTVSDLEFTLTHNGIFDTLIYRVNGNGGENFFNTYLNDNLGISFEGAIAPFTGIFIPQNELSNFTGISVAGEWVLTINDYKSGDDGVLQDWGLVISESSIVEVEGTQSLNPSSFALSQNYPNPFNPSTNIQYTISSRQFVTLKVYDILGNEIATLVNEEKPAGKYEVEFSPVSGSRHSASGIYFCRLQTENFTKTIKMLYLK